MTDPALRPQPRRDGADFWPTPPCLVRALCRDVLPELPAGPIWECAAGDGRLAGWLRQAGRTVFASDLLPGASGIARHDFLRADVPDTAYGASVVTNPPYSQLNEFITRGLALLDRGAIPALVLLLRIDHLQAGERVDVLNRASLVLHCAWRPVWKKPARHAGRWSNAWVVWRGDRHGPTQIVWVREDDRQRALSFASEPVPQSCPASQTAPGGSRPRRRAHVHG